MLTVCRHDTVVLCGSLRVFISSIVKSRNCSSVFANCNTHFVILLFVRVVASIFCTEKTKSIYFTVS